MEKPIEIPIGVILEHVKHMTEKPAPIPVLSPLTPKEKTLIIGHGEIGKSLEEVLSSAYEVHWIDLAGTSPTVDKHYDVINVTIPYSENFVQIVKDAIAKYTPQLAIIHSTVKPGTTRKIGDVAVHSPVNGKHPNLAPSIKTFVKFIGGVSGEKTFKAVGFLQKAGINTHVFSSPEATEVAKILCTTQYGWSIVAMKEIHRIAKEMNVPFHEIYTEWNNAYNQGYLAMNQVQFFRPILVPMEGPIGGHCVVPNTELFEDFLTGMVKERNKTYGKRKTKYVKRK